MPNPGLKIGFLLQEEDKLPAWEYDMLLELLKSSFVEEVVLIHIPLPLFHSRQRTEESFTLGLFRRFENAWFTNLPDASRVVDLCSLKDSYSQLRSINPSSSLELTFENIDLLYNTYNLNGQKFSKTPRLGIWQIQYGDYPGSGNDLPVFWEVMSDELVTSARLLVCREDEANARIVYHAVCTVVPFSVKNSFNEIAWKATHFLPARLKELHQTGFLNFFSKYEETMPKHSGLKDKSKRQGPSDLLMCWLFIRNIFRYSNYKIKSRFNKKKFTVLYARQPLSMEREISIEKFMKLTPPRKAFWADPFVIAHEHDFYIFFEDSPLSGEKARLAVIKIDALGEISDPEVVLERPYHLSYPFIFQLEREYYLIPDTSGNRTVELYRCKKFPLQWVFVKCLLRGVLLQDPTLFFFQGRWWLFGSTRTPKCSTSNDQLSIYYATDIFSEDWTPHAGNPVITDVSNCRPAGKIFIIGSRIFRPAQNNASRQYGYAVCINEIELLTPTEYKERPICSISPAEHKKFAAVHTINASEDMVVIDGILY